MARGDPQLHHLDHAYSSTVHAAQGMTCDRVIAVLDSDGGPLADRATFYVELTRARDNVVLLTDDRGGLAEALEARTGEEPPALEMIGAQFGEDGPAAALPEREAPHPELERWEAFAADARSRGLEPWEAEGCADVLGPVLALGEFGGPGLPEGVRHAAREHAAMRRAAERRRAERLSRELRGLLRERAGVPVGGAAAEWRGRAEAALSGWRGLAEGSGRDVDAAARVGRLLASDARKEELEAEWTALREAAAAAGLPILRAEGCRGLADRVAAFLREAEGPVAWPEALARLPEDLGALAAAETRLREIGALLAEADGPCDRADWRRRAEAAVRDAGIPHGRDGGPVPAEVAGRLGAASAELVRAMDLEGGLAALERDLADRSERARAEGVHPSDLAGHDGLVGRAHALAAGPAPPGGPPEAALRLLAGERDREAAAEEVRGCLRDLAALRRERAGLLAEAAGGGVAAAELPGYPDWRGRTGAALAALPDIGSLSSRHGTAAFRDLRDPIAAAAGRLGRGMDLDARVAASEREREALAARAAAAGAHPAGTEGHADLVAAAEDLAGAAADDGGTLPKGLAALPAEAAAREAARTEAVGRIAALESLARERGGLLSEAGAEGIAVARLPAYDGWRRRAETALAAVPDLAALEARHGTAAFRGLEVRLGRAADGVLPAVRFDGKAAKLERRRMWTDPNATDAAAALALEAEALAGEMAGVGGIPAGLGNLIAAERGRRELRERAEAWLRRAGALARERTGLLARAAPTGDAVTDMTGYFNGWREKAEAAAAEGTALADRMRRRSPEPPANRVAAKARELRAELDRDWDIWHLERDIVRHRSKAVRAGTDPYAADGADGLAARAEACEALRLRPGEASYRMRDFVEGHREHAARRREFGELLAAVRRCARERDRLLAKAGDRDLPFRAVLRTRPGLWRWRRQAPAAAAACRRLLGGPDRYGAFLDAEPDGRGLVRRTLDIVGRARELDNLPAGLLRRLRNNAAEADAAGIDHRVTDAYPGIVGALEGLASPRLVSRAETRSVAEALSGTTDRSAGRAI